MDAVATTSPDVIKLLHKPQALDRKASKPRATTYLLNTVNGVDRATLAFTDVADVYRTQSRGVLFEGDFLTSLGTH